MNEIIINNLAIGYRHKVVASHLTAKMLGGEFTCLIGRNGLGKSTLLKTIAGLVPPLSGNITINIEGKVYDTAKLSRKALSRLVAIVLTERVDIANARAVEVVEMGRMPYTGFFGKLSDDDKSIVAEAMERTATVALSDRSFDTLSDGERQKVMIARALAQQTPVMLLDEPTAFLDYESKTGIMQMLHSLAHGMGKVIIASTHDLDIAGRTADRLITLGENGGIKSQDK